MGVKALTNLRMKVLKISLSSKLLSVLGTSEEKQNLHANVTLPQIYGLTQRTMEDWPSTVSQRATAPYTSSRMRMTTRLMMAAVAFTVSRTLERVVGFELMCRAVLVDILYRMTPNTIANVTPIWKRQQTGEVTTWGKKKEGESQSNLNECSLLS